MKSLMFKGCGTALVTPFSGGYVNLDRFASLVDRQVEAGVDFLVPLGTTGETPCLSEEERLQLLVTAKEHSAGRPVMVGVGTNSLDATLRNIRQIENYGADAFLVVVPYYNKPTQQGQYEYFRAIAEASSKSIVIYNVPGRTGVNMTAETCLRLAEEVENIVAVKEASGNYAQISEIIRNRPEGFSVLSGNDNETLSLMATGADGVISVASNLVPAEMTALVRAMQEGRLDEARRLNFRLMPLFKGCFIESNPIPVKAGMASLGLLEDSLRLPLTSASAATRAAMEEILKDLDILKK
ncbi:MAG: 4-hydroxy-tetrahydrodipicolinate synthase [Candidatus Cryptobacteroides sp.]|nr:4-hydroxy-tetrahydrodipicolinate synthase [Bacteroidales bacterium]MDY2706880.1 4-hydroxy-tetrahydrodipicolinate synthase [Candidatus Cryptobacteroides sp.]MCI7750133.1 4-hydroxy-tetrahydrodipicolinate synthase [Bacteroidales bacterium]MDD7531251.1 4-hydroxy-tetrahydrodipicolinate synthase [Bacteroidales bacterium]MDY4630841.1 4-hydroxy-tetrahydrodipicolinate synthase [Candidatus Cryptobacteroides sp.]